MSKGFIPIRRTLFDHFLFKEKRIFSRFEAWLDLIQLASFKDENSDIIGGKLVKKDRGEIVASIRFLSIRWNWSMHKVCDYIELLRSQNMVVVDKGKGINKILLVNFEKHNSLSITENQEGNSKRHSKRNTQSIENHSIDEDVGTVKGTAKGTNAAQSGNSEGTNIKKGNKDNEVKDGPKQIDFKKRDLEFYNQLATYIDKFSKKMLRAFYDYWSEPNKSRTKMKWEMQETWDLEKRLAKWELNEQKFRSTKETTIDTDAAKQGQKIAEAKARSIIDG